MSTKHVPIDPNDDSPETRKNVWQTVAEHVGSPLTPIAANRTFEGIWDVDSLTSGEREPIFEYDFADDGTMTITALTGVTQSTDEDSYEVRSKGQLVMSSETYHAASTRAGELVIFNGDGSKVLIAKPREEP